ncbi:hypothetical protein OAF42_01405 [Planctomicrobium sp.]|nr:hypothetical protein [Planctomicrobium sp.]MDB4733077.1 hypothetical protein [Planctomicrobium sp.]
MSHRVSYILVLSIVFMSGCSSSSDNVDRLKTVPASGKLTLDGTAYGPATLDLLPLSKSGERSRSASAKVSEDGNFVVGTYEDDDGIVPGEFSVRLNLLDSAMSAPNVEDYQFTVGSDGDENLTIALKSKKDNAGTLMSPKLESGGAGTGL